MISINLYEIIMQMVNFMILLWLMKRFLYKPLIAFLDKREQGIENDINKAQNNKEESESILNQQKDLLKKAHLEAKDIREKAEDVSKKERELILEKTKRETELIVSNTKKELQLDYIRAKKELEKEVAQLAVKLSERIMEKEVSKDQQEKMISNYLTTSRG